MKIKTRRYYIYYLARIGIFLVSMLPVKVGLVLAELAGKVIYLLLKEPREIAFENLKSSFPEKTDAEIARIVKGVFLNLCKNAIELLNAYKINKGNIDKWVRPEGVDIIEKAFSQKNGIIVLASHFGNWDLMAMWFALKGYGANAIAKRIYFERYENLMNKMRSAKGIKIIYREESPKKILAALKRNEPLGILADQDVDSVDGVFVDFFGKPAFTPKSPVAIALASKAPLIPCFLIREKSGHRLVFEKPIEIVDKGNKEETIRFNTQEWSRVVESYIRKYPSQWVWMHKRWKTKSQEA
ncbi:MAG: lysophospholipid acyltransferase family protein [Candidatus Omnitrophica bacterium]|nr:lysophospholipid acyltransferase family protein [Candidatus Omnitrophota bacterium]